MKAVCRYGPKCKNKGKWCTFPHTPAEAETMREAEIKKAAPPAAAAALVPAAAAAPPVAAAAPPATVDAVPLVPLTMAILEDYPEGVQKNMIGQQLYPLIAQLQPDLAGKITGMLLEIEIPHLLVLLESPEALRMKTLEALDVYEAHMSAQG